MRAKINYGDRIDYTQSGMPLDWLYPGLYKVRLRSFGPWVPVRVWYEDGERDPETWELLSDQKLCAEWWPQTNSTRSFEVPAQWFFNRARPIDEREFQWMMQLKTIKR